MNGSRLYIGDTYYNKEENKDGSCETEVVSKNSLLLKIGNKYINTLNINSKYDLLKLYTVLKYFKLGKKYSLSKSFYEVDSKSENTKFVLGESLNKFFDGNIKINFKDLRDISISYNFSEEDAINKLRKRYQNK